MQQTVELEPKEENFGRKLLLQTVTDISEIRTSTTSNTRYLEEKQTELLFFSQDIFESGPSKLWRDYSGIIGESLFFLACKSNSIPIQISTGQEDLKGIDFYVFGYPVDVTANYQKQDLQRKIDTKRFATLFLPRFIGNVSIYTRPVAQRAYTKELFKYGDINSQRYLEEVLNINTEVQNLIEKEFYFQIRTPILTKRVGINNIHNIATVLTLLSSFL